MSEEIISSMDSDIREISVEGDWMEVSGLGGVCISTMKYYNTVTKEQVRLGWKDLHR